MPKLLQPWGVRVLPMQAFRLQAPVHAWLLWVPVPRFLVGVCWERKSPVCRVLAEKTLPMPRRPVLTPFPTPSMSILLLDGLWAQAGGCGVPPVELCLRLASRRSPAGQRGGSAPSPCIMGSRTSLSFRISNATGSGWKLLSFLTQHCSKIHRCCSQILLIIFFLIREHKCFYTLQQSCSNSVKISG